MMGRGMVAGGRGGRGRGPMGGMMGPGDFGMMPAGYGPGPNGYPGAHLPPWLPMDWRCSHTWTFKL